MLKQLLLVGGLCLMLSGIARADAPAYVWAEGEAPASVSPAGFKPEITDVGTPQFLSGGKWLHVSVAAKDVDKMVPAEGIVLSYSVTAPKAAAYEIWGRMGYQASRSAFDWRLDGGDWHTVAPGAPFVQIQQLQTWNDVSWMHLGDQSLTAGAHTLDFRVSKAKDDKGNFQDLQFACDALCLSAGPFHPNDRYKPDDTSWQTDADRAAAKTVFDVAAPSGAAQAATPLAGAWQMARDEEDRLHDVDGPISSVSGLDTLAWKAMAVPGGRDEAHPEWLYAHRYLLRTQVNVPAALAGRSFVLHFPALNMLATVFVNGQPCGFDNTPLAAWDCDITRAVRPGQVNEVVVGIKDWYYALPDLGAQEGQTLHYMPTDWVTKFGPGNFTYPIWNHEDSGILRTPTLIAGGAAYTGDVFCKPSVRGKTLGLEITINNPSGEDHTVSIGNSVAPLTGGPAEKTFAARTVTVPAGGSKVVPISEAWASPKLWWPDAPSQYVVTTTLSEGGRTVDARTTKFGFREWDWDGDDFKLNGVPWHGRADISALGPPLSDAWLAKYHAHGQDMIRLWDEGANVNDALDWYDAHGVNVRRTNIFDGETAKYQMNNAALWDHYHAQLGAWIKGQRNHPQHLHLVGGERNHVYQRPRVRPGPGDDRPAPQDRAGGGGGGPDAALHGGRRQRPAGRKFPRLRRALHGTALPEFAGGRVQRPGGVRAPAGLAGDPTQADPARRGVLLGRQRPRRLRHDRWRGGVCRQGRGRAGHRPHRQDALRGLPLGWHQLPLLGGGHVRPLLQLVAAGRRAVPPVGQHVRCRAVRPPDFEDLQRHA